jgi:hypothetical protein
VSRPTRVRLELDQRRASALHAAVSEALSADLLAGDRRDAARELLEQLDQRVPGWLDAAPVGGQAGYLLAAEAVLRALVAAEDRGRDTLSELELLRALGNAKPLGTTASDVLDRMRREKLIRNRASGSDRERWWVAAPAGRQFLHRDTAARDDAWKVHDPDALLDLIYAEHRPGGRAHRPSVQAIGRLDTNELTPLLAQLQAQGLLDAGATDERWLELTPDGVERVRARWRESAPQRRYSWDGPPPPPRPYHRRLPVRIDRDDRRHPGRWPEDGDQRYCPPAAWLQRSSTTKLWATLKRDGATVWRCQHCDSHWLVYLQAYTSDGQPAYRDPGAATHNRPLWRSTWKP